MGLTMTDLFPDAPSASDGQAAPPGNTRHPKLSLLDLALEKQLHWKFLFHLGVMELPSGDLQIPYHLPDGALAPRHRIRTALVAKEGSLWSKGKGTIVPYGLSRLEEARKAGYLVLVEGESDCWTLWYQQFPALGLPGAEMARTLEESMLAGIDRLYIMQEPDAGGTAFVTQITRKLEAWQWSGKAFVLRLEGAKDPNELHQQDRLQRCAGRNHRVDGCDRGRRWDDDPETRPWADGGHALCHRARCRARAAAGPQL
jgi:putative DNA primase/helicase